MSKLLSDEAMYEELQDLLHVSFCEFEPQTENSTRCAICNEREWDIHHSYERIVAFINTQKRLYAEMIVDIDTDVDIPEALKKIYTDGYCKGYNDRTYENSYNSVDYRMAEAIAPAVAKVRSRYDKQLKALESK